MSPAFERDPSRQDKIQFRHLETREIFVIRSSLVVSEMNSRLRRLDVLVGCEPPILVIFLLKESLCDCWNLKFVLAIPTGLKGVPM